MKAIWVAAAAVSVLLATPFEAGARGYGHWGGHGGRYWGGHGGYYGGHGHYHGGGWPYFGIGLVVGGLAGAWARPYPAYYAYPPVPYYAYPSPPPAPMPPHACGSWVWDDPGYTWYWEPCAPGGPRVVVPHEQMAPEPPMAPPAPAPEMAPRG